MLAVRGGSVSTMRDIIDRLRRQRLHERLRTLLGDRGVIHLQRVAAVPFRRNLMWLAVIYWSDKAGEHGYTEAYQRHFRSLRRRPLTLLEIGIGGYDSPSWGGSSLRVWRDYFRRGQVHGLDIHRKDISGTRLTAHQGDQSDGAWMERFGAAHGPFDIVIDDGSHVNAHIRTSFAALFADHLKPGGWYVIEDMATAYDPAFGGGAPGTAGTSTELVKHMIDDINVAHSVIELHVYEQVAFIRKAP